MTRLAATLDCHPGWSAFYDNRYGRWRTAEDDPASLLYAETPDPDAIIAYISSHAEGPPAAPGEDRARLTARFR